MKRGTLSYKLLAFHKLSTYDPSISHDDIKILERQFIQRALTILEPCAINSQVPR